MRLILFAHGSRDPQWRDAIETLVGSVRQAVDPTIDVAYLEHLEPTLPEAVARAAAAGATHVRVLPLFLAPGAHVRRDLPALAAEARRRHPGVRLDVLPAIGTDARFTDLVTALAADAMRH